MPTLIIEHQGRVQAGALSGRVLIGRWPDNAISINDRTVSRIHAWVGVQQGEYYIADAGSRTGTFVNGHPLHERHVLQDGDEIRIGPGIIRYRQDAEAPADAAEIDLSPRTPDELSGDHGVFMDCVCGAPLWLPRAFTGVGQCRYCGHTVTQGMEQIAPPVAMEPDAIISPPVAIEPDPIIAPQVAIEPDAIVVPPVAIEPDAIIASPVAIEPDPIIVPPPVVADEIIEQSAEAVMKPTENDDDEFDAVINETFSKPKLPATPGRRVPPPAPIARPTSRVPGPVVPPAIPPRLMPPAVSPQMKPSAPAAAPRMTPIAPPPAAKLPAALPPRKIEPPIRAQEAQVCGICHAPITVFDEVKACPSCGLGFHAECWQENHGCSAYGCPQVNAAG